MLKYLHLYLFKYGQVVHWYGQMFFKPIVRGQVYISQISPPLRTRIAHVRFSNSHARGKYMYVQVSWLIYKKDSSMIPEIQSAAVLKWRSYNRRNCGIGCFKSSWQWHRNTRLYLFVFLRKIAEQQEARRASGDGGSMGPLPIVCRCLFRLSFCYLLWWHLEHKWCNESSTQLLCTAEISVRTTCVVSAKHELAN